jgi:Leucine-rich repeat (LRR) protein
MGCKSSTESSAALNRPSSRASRDDSSMDDDSSTPVFGSGVHVGRAGNVDLSGRDLDVLGPHMVNMINEDDLHRTATSLTLSNNRLYALAKELPLLTKLRELDIDHNRFQRFPEVLVRLPRLWRINASFNPIESSRGFEVLPRLVSLKSLNVRDCGLKEIPMAIVQCEVLEDLDIGNNPEIKITGVALHRLSRLKKLGVANCNLSGRTLPNTIKRMKLTSLDISGNDFTFSDPHFFGSNLPRTLVELHLVGMKLTAPPAVVALLKHLNFLDLAENPIETLDVLAGRVVKRLPHVSSNGTVATNGTNALTELPDEEEKDFEEEETATQVSGGGASNTTSRVSLSKVSKVGIVAHVTQPIPLKRLSLRACGFRMVPKYFHKLDQLEDLDLSENENLDDPNMTLFSLQSLVSLNITGCPFAEDPSQSRNEWFDIGKLRELRNIQWEVWKSEHNMSPYRTKIPIELCGLRLRTLNEVELRKNLFTGDMIQTVINLLSDGYFKVDLSVDEMVLFGHLAAVKSFAEAERFFFPKTVTESPNVTCPVAPASLGEVHLKIAISRYIFFLAMQAANYDAVIIPPLDVMILHYAQLTTNPLNYRIDCEAVCGRILNCNYRTFFAEQKKHQTEAKGVVDASRRIWNLMVRSAQRDLAWLRYDFWDKRLRSSQDASGGRGASANAAPAASGSGGAAAAAAAESVKGPSATTTTSSSMVDNGTAIPKTLPLLVGKTTAEVTQDWQSLLSIDSAGDLAGVLDQAITSHFAEKGTQEFANSIATFFRMNHCFIRHEDSLWKADLDWNRYVKFLTLYAYRCAVLDENNTYVMEPVADEEGNLCPPTRTTSVLGKRYDKMINQSFSSSSKYLPQPSESPGDVAGIAGASSALVGEDGVSLPQNRTQSGITRRSSSTILLVKKSSKRLTMVQQLEGNPVPTIGITFMLHAHRTSQLKYYQSLSLFAIENVDVTWGEAPTDRILRQTQNAWMALYDEAYVSENRDMPFGYTIHDGVLMPSNDPWLKDTLSPATAAAQAPATVTAAKAKKSEAAKHRYSYNPSATPGPSVVRTKSKKSAAGTARGVTFCSADTEFGVF